MYMTEKTLYRNACKSMLRRYSKFSTLIGDIAKDLRYCSGLNEEKSNPRRLYISHSAQVCEISYQRACRGLAIAD